MSISHPVPLFTGNQSYAFHRSSIHIQWNTDNYVENLLPGWGESFVTIISSRPLALWSLRGVEKEEPLTALPFHLPGPTADHLLWHSQQWAVFDEVTVELTSPFRTSFLPHLLQLGVGNGYRSLWFRVQYLKWQIKFYYFILESSGFVFSKLIVIRLSWQLIQRLDLSTEWNAWGSYRRHLGNSGTHREVAWWAWIAVGRVHCRVRLLSVYMLLFWQSEYSCPTYTDTLLFREILSFFLSFFFFLFRLSFETYVRVIEDSRTSKLFLYKR